MNKSKINIAFIDTSCIIFNGLSAIFQKTGQSPRINFYPDLEMFLQDMATFNPNLVIIDPLIITSNMKEFLRTRNNIRVKWVGILYTFYSREVLSVLDGTIQITDSYNDIKNTIETLIFRDTSLSSSKESEPLTARETDILKLMTQSLSNKEIASKLNISVHTVKAHRRKIITKTGTCKPYELLNYALSNKIVSME